MTKVNDCTPCSLPENFGQVCKQNGGNRGTLCDVRSILTLTFNCHQLLETELQIIITSNISVKFTQSKLYITPIPQRPGFYTYDNYMTSMYYDINRM